MNRVDFGSIPGDVDGDNIFDSLDDIEVNCGCPAGAAAEEYYLCDEYVSIRINNAVGGEGLSEQICYSAIEIERAIGKVRYSTADLVIFSRHHPPLGKELPLVDWYGCWRGLWLDRLVSC